MKKIYSWLIMALLICTFSITALAAGDSPRVVDDADLLSSSEEKELTEKLDKISEKHQVDVVVVTVDDIGSSSVRDYADDYYDYNGYGYGSEYDGVLLLINMSGRDWYISTCGYGIKAFTDYGIDYIGNQITPELGDGKYAKAFDEFADLADTFIQSAKDGKPIRSKKDLPKGPFPWLKAICGSLLLALLIAIIRILCLFGELKSVRKQERADYYSKEGSMHVTDRREFFLYRKVDRTKKPESSGSGSSTHVSSSGRTHGGGGGKF